MLIEQSVNVRGLGVIGSLSDIENIVLTQQGGVPVLLSDVAKVQIGFTPRLGMAGRDDKTDVIFGIVLMQKLERTMDVQLFVRTRQNVELTDAGTELLRHSRGLLADREDAVAAVRRVERGEAGVLRLGVALLAEHEVGRASCRERV